VTSLEPVARDDPIPEVAKQKKIKAKTG
jgi:hypothetical protein